MGIAAGLLYVPSVAVQAHHWRKRRALAMGIVATGCPIHPHVSVYSYYSF
jgi:hypothetical protein